MAKKKKETVKTSNIVASGKRKTSIAKAFITSGNGKIFINRKNINTFNYFEKLRIKEVIDLAEQINKEILKNIDIKVIVYGGGKTSRLEAVRLAIAKALVDYSKDKALRDNFIRYDRSLLVADTRRKEQRKPNDSKARAKRQKSYR
ncbi:30S ribosomal protein S9 [Candidatus Pacearchaeota archaeon CG_4_9_14_3_um_filter_31_7]|nr:MAG: 30S ribosomal protein S9 [Candidatus Pacearchaeota archaeon CG1_02_31_27]PIN92425.1 MAG: 30S ribosomal protein S9 [Candidatus Pacearchaeota archaeon CG10_big_fil_rev_8_21_14_0_10_31_59]PIZ81010.1 MAG: 30S ribosomal protein S9 [Candidatus Pacearchaeota archaeon CG_4_10_14_0_2_um_filter_31_10]PJA70507.1 MAG: 30S ribosomal protein S9 [Candidatus Pacearchaeota archaeon CG_4_9_14_3_um_filter_31_7]